MDVPRVLVRARHRAVLSRARLAELAGTSPSALSAYERGVRSPTVATLDRLLQACGLQLRVDLEPYLADVDAAVDAMLVGGSELPAGTARLTTALDEAGLTWAFDGQTALVLHGLSGADSFPEVVLLGDDAMRTFLYRHGVTALDREGQPLWDNWLSVDLAAVGRCMAWTGVGVFTLRVAAELTVPVRIVSGGGVYPTLSLVELERAHPALSVVLGRLRERRTV